MPQQTALQQALTAAYQAAAQAVTEERAGKSFSPTPDDYYTRPEVPDTEVTDALAEAGIQLNSRPV
ncbi:hypothetical protein AB0C77_23450 [Streptomyces sp. NPDC048629]|uniref:hypothetical protein n=1 Tax=Streptomyces sp. NPDC048629 TaxID=3154824 RepID=UPI00341DEF00